MVESVSQSTSPNISNLDPGVLPRVNELNRLGQIVDERGVISLTKPHIRFVFPAEEILE